MSTPSASPDGAEVLESTAFPRPPYHRSKSSGYKLFPTVNVEPTPPTSPITLQKRSLSRARDLPRTRSVSLDSTVRIAAGQQDAVVKTVPVRRGRKVSVEELSKYKSRHMSTVQEVPSPSVSIPYSFLPRSSEDAGHARSNSAPGEFVRDSQTLPSAKLDLSKPQWTSKQADSHPSKGLGLSMPASVSVDRLDQKRAPPSARTKPNLTIEIKNDTRMKPKAIIVRDDIEDDQPPPPPPKSPRHDSRNHSLNNIAFEPRKARRTHSRTVSRTSAHSNSSPDSAHPSEQATVASHGSFVKASLVHTPSPSSTTPPKPLIPVPKHESASPLSGDVRIKELMEMTGKDAQDDLERPVPPPITPGRPRVASIGRVVSGPKPVSTEKGAGEGDSQKKQGNSPVPRGPTKSDTSAPDKATEKQPPEADKQSNGKTTDSAETAPIKQQPRPEIKREVSPAVSTATAKGTKRKAPKPNLDKPMPSLPPPSSRHSEYMREVQAKADAESQNVPPVPTATKSMEQQAADPTKSNGAALDARAGMSAAQSAQGKPVIVKEVEKLDQVVKEKQEAPAATGAQAKHKEDTPKSSEKAAKGPGLSAFPSVPARPEYYTGSPRTQSPAGRMPPNQRPPPARDMRQQDVARSSSPVPKLPPGHPMHQRPHSPSPPRGPAPSQPGPPRSRFYGRQPESANSSQVTVVDRRIAEEGRNAEVARHKMASPEPAQRVQSPAPMAGQSQAIRQPTSAQSRTTPVLQRDASPMKQNQDRLQSEDPRQQAATDAKPAVSRVKEQTPTLLQRSQSPAFVERAASPAPSGRPTSPANLLDKIASAKAHSGQAPAPGPRSATPDAASTLISDAKPAAEDPTETLRQLTRQSEALHARHAVLRADRLKLSTAISASLRESKPGPEYANMLLDQHLSLNAINSSLDICFAKLKTIDYKKEEAIQALLEQTKEKQAAIGRHRSTTSTSFHSQKASMSSASSKASTPEIGHGHLPPLQERQSQEVVPKMEKGDESTSNDPKINLDSPILKHTPTLDVAIDTDGERASMDSLPTPRPLPPLKAAATGPKKARNQSDASTASNTMSDGEKKNAAVKTPYVSPAPSLFAKKSVDMSPVSPIDDNDQDASMPSKRITVKGAKAAKILGLVSARSESPSSITLPDSSPPSSRDAPAKDFTVEMKIHRKPLPKPPASQPPAPSMDSTRTQPGRKLTSDSASTVHTDSSPESEVGTPRASEDDMVPKSLKVGRKAQPVQVVQDDDILDYYSR